MKKVSKIVLGCTMGGMCLAIMLLCAGCKGEKEPIQKIKDLEFTVIAEENIPEEFLVLLQEKKEDGMKMTYQDAGFLYICIGYGRQESGGFSIAVNEVYETDNAIYFDTTLLGPQPGDDLPKKNSPSFPFIVVKTEFIDKPVVFE